MASTFGFVASCSERIVRWTNHLQGVGVEPPACHLQGVQMACGSRPPSSETLRGKTKADPHPGGGRHLAVGLSVVCILPIIENEITSVNKHNPWFPFDQRADVGLSDVWSNARSYLRCSHLAPALRRLGAIRRGGKEEPRFTAPMLPIRPPEREAAVDGGQL